MALHLLSKKSWHVWNADNLERVRQDEAQHAAEVEEQTSKKVAADQGALFDALRARAAAPVQSWSAPPQLKNAHPETGKSAGGTAPGQPAHGKNQAKRQQAPTDGIPLVDSSVAAGPWYAQAAPVGRATSSQSGSGVRLVEDHEGQGEEDRAGQKDQRRKAADDPLALVRRTLSAAPSQSTGRPTAGLHAPPLQAYGQTSSRAPHRGEGAGVGSSAGEGTSPEVTGRSARSARTPGDATPLSRVLATPSSSGSRAWGPNDGASGTDTPILGLGLGLGLGHATTHAGAAGRGVMQGKHEAQGELGSRARHDEAEEAGRRRRLQRGRSRSRSRSRSLSDTDRHGRGSGSGRPRDGEGERRKGVHGGDEDRGRRHGKGRHRSRSRSDSRSRRGRRRSRSRSRSSSGSRARTTRRHHTRDRDHRDGMETEMDGHGASGKARGTGGAHRAQGSSSAVRAHVPAIDSALLEALRRERLVREATETAKANSLLGHGTAGLANNGSTGRRAAYRR